MTTRKVIITSTNAKLINRFGSQCLVLNVSELTTQTRKSQLHVYTKNASDLESYLPFIQIGQTLTIPNEQSVNGIIKIIQKYDDNFQIDEKGNSLRIKAISNAILALKYSKIESITDSYLKHLAEWPFTSGRTLYSLTKIGASHKSTNHHFRPGGLIDHMEEMTSFQSVIQDTFSVDHELATVVAIWHDLGKTKITSTEDPTKCIAPPDQSCGHDSWTSHLLGFATSEYPHDIEVETSSTYRTLQSVLGNIHNPTIYNKMKTFVQKSDGRSVEFDKQIQDEIKSKQLDTMRENNG
tara:strand:- start:185 stop:1069 length:885 start_codon:yes stop_codon:yes gene_type:complete